MCGADGADELFDAVNHLFTNLLRARGRLRRLLGALSACFDRDRDLGHTDDLVAIMAEKVSVRAI